MRQIIAVLGLAACGGEPIDLGYLEEPFTGTVQGDPNPLTFWWYATAEEKQEPLRAELECALVRWRQATCLDTDVSFDAHHWVRIVPLAGLAGQVNGSWDSTRVKLDDDLLQDAWCQVLVHEIGHVLRRTNAHPGPDGSMSYPTTHVYSPPISRIMQADIDLVCAVQDCGCSVPEP